jgi:O-antigen/teichoic acid export membrane protein
MTIELAPALEEVGAGLSGDGSVLTGSAPRDADVALATGEPRVARNFVALLGGQLVTWTMTIVWTLIVPRVLGPRGFGVVTAALSVSGVFAIILGLGTRSYLVREIVIHRERAAKLMGTAIVLRLLLAPVVAVTAVVFAILAHYDHEQAVALYLAATMNVLLLLYDPLQAMFQAVERMKYLAFSDIINKSAQSLIGIAVALAGLGAVGITANMAVIAVVVLALNILWMRRFIRVDLRTNLRMMGSMVKHSFTYWATGVFFTIYLWVDAIMLSVMTGSRVVGWYGASTTIFQTLMFLPGLLSTTWLPRLVEAFKVSREHLYRTARKPLEFVLVISAPMAAGTAMAGHAMVHVLYGSAYAHAVPVVVILGLCLPPTYMNMMMSGVLIAEGRQVVFQWLMVGATIVNPAVNLVLIPITQRRYHNGAIGAAIALLATELLVAVGAFMFVHRVFDRTALRRWGLAAVASAAMWCVAYAAQPLGEAVALAAGVLTLLVLIVTLRLPTDEELRFLRQGAGRVKARLIP